MEEDHEWKVRAIEALEGIERTLGHMLERLRELLAREVQVQRAVEEAMRAEYARWDK